MTTKLVTAVLAAAVAAGLALPAAAQQGVTDSEILIADILPLTGPPAMLGVGRFVVRGRLARAPNIADRARATAAFERMLAAKP